MYIRIILKQNVHNALLNYIVNLIYIGLSLTIMHSFNLFLSLLQDLGLEVSQSKLVPPYTQIVCLDILVDNVQKMYFNFK